MYIDKNYISENQVQRNCRLKKENTDITQLYQGTEDPSTLSLSFSIFIFHDHTTIITFGLSSPCSSMGSGGATSGVGNMTPSRWLSII